VKPIRKEKNMKKHKRFLAVACVVFMAVSFNGCASTGILPPQYVGNERQNYGRIGVVAARFQPQVKVDVLTSGKGAGAGKGAGHGALAGLAACGHGSCSGSFCGIVLLLCLAIAPPVGAVIGAIAGAVVTESAEKIAAEEAAMKTRLEALKMQEILRDQVIEYAKEVEYTGLSILKDQGPEDMNALPVYRPATGEHLDTVVELSLLRFEAEVTGAKGNPISVKAIFRVRVVNASDGKVLDSFTHQSIAAGIFDDWIKDNAQMLANAIQFMYRDFAEVVVDELFLNYRPVGEADDKTAQQEIKKADTDIWEQHMVLSDYVLQPLYPEVWRKLLPFGDFSFGGLIVRDVDSSEPTLSWEALPKLKELSKARAGSRITDVKYDLRIFNYRYFLKALVANKQIYQITGLTEPKFKLSGFFKPCHVYFWTVRARFLLDGTRQATEWSGTYYNIGARPWTWRRDDSYIPWYISKEPNYFYYLPFRIPAALPSEKCPKIPPSEAIVRGIHIPSVW